MREGWRRVAIGEICTLTKGVTPTQKAIPGQYPLVVTAADPLSSDQYQFEGEAVCVPLVSSTGHGHASLKRVHYAHGKFAVANIITALEARGGANVNMKFLWLALDHGRDEVIVPLMKGTANVSLSQRALASAQIELPSLEEQRRIVDLIGSVDHATGVAESNRDSLAVLRRSIVESFGKGGECTRIGDLAEVSQGRNLPKAVQGEQSGDTPWYKVADMARAHNVFGYVRADTRMDEKRISDLRGRVVPSGAVVFPRVGAAVQTEKKRLVETPGAVDENHIVLTPRRGVSGELLLAAMESLSLSSLAQTGAVPSLNMSIVRSAAIDFPVGEATEALSDLLGSTRLTGRAYALEIDRLRLIRSNLLTALLSGEHEIPATYDELMEETTV